MLSGVSVPVSLALPMFEMRIAVLHEIVGLTGGLFVVGCAGRAVGR